VLVAKTNLLVQAPEEHEGLDPMQRRPHSPQLFTSVPELDSQPFAELPSQLLKPGEHVK
jgi:hypothetical protein